MDLGQLVIALTPFVATGAAAQAARVTTVAWAQALGGAAVILGALTCVGGILYLLRSSSCDA